MTTLMVPYLTGRHHVGMYSDDRAHALVLSLPLSNGGRYVVHMPYHGETYTFVHPHMLQSLTYTLADVTLPQIRLSQTLTDLHLALADRGFPGILKPFFNHVITGDLAHRVMIKTQATGSKPAGSLPVGMSTSNVKSFVIDRPHTVTIFQKIPSNGLYLPVVGFYVANPLEGLEMAKDNPKDEI